MLLPPPQNRWHPIISDHRMVHYFLKHYPYLGTLDWQTNLKCFGYGREKALVITFNWPYEAGMTEVGFCSKPTESGKLVKMMGLLWLEKYRNNYGILVASVLKSHKTAKLLCYWMGFKPYPRENNSYDYYILE